MLRRGCFAAVCVLTFSGFAHAQSIETVTVTAARMPEPVGQSAFSVVTLSAASLSRAGRLDAALEQVPGVSLFRRGDSLSANPTTQGISLRAIAPSGAGRALVLLDGVPMNDPFGNWVIWTALPWEDIGQAQIVRGAGTGPYGSGALTGTIALTERSGQGLAVADASAGSLGTTRLGAAGGAKIGQVSFFASASAEHADGWFPVMAGQRGAADRPLWFNGASGSLRAQATLEEGLTFSARLGLYDETRGNGVIGGRAGANGEVASVALARTATRSRPGWRLQLWSLSSNLNNTFTSEALNHMSALVVDNQYATPAWGWGANAAMVGASGPWRWELGGDLRDDSGESRELYLPVQGIFQDRRRAGGRLVIVGLYGEGAWRHQGWLLTAGVRADRWATSQGHLVESRVASDALIALSDPPSRSGIVPTGRIGIKRNLSGGLYLRAAAYAGFRVPSLNELYRPFRVGSVITSANANLKPEQLYGEELGSGGQHAGWKWSLTAFYNQLANAITNVTVSTTPQLTFQQRENAGTIDALGLEGEASVALSKQLVLYGAYALTDARVHAHGPAAQLNGKRPAQDPVATITAGADYSPLDPLRLSARVRYESARYNDDLNRQRLGAAVTIDLRADWRLRQAWDAYISLDNAANARVAYQVDAPGVDLYAEPRRLMVGLTYEP